MKAPLGMPPPSAAAKRPDLISDVADSDDRTPAAIWREAEVDLGLASAADYAVHALHISTSESIGAPRDRKRRRRCTRRSAGSPHRRADLGRRRRTRRRCRRDRCAAADGSHTRTSDRPASRRRRSRSRRSEMCGRRRDGTAASARSETRPRTRSRFVYMKLRRQSVRRPRLT